MKKNSKSDRMEKLQDQSYKRAVKAKERLDKKPHKNTKIKYDPILMASDLWHESLLHDEDPEEED